MVALYLSLLSGIIVALQYDPGAPYYSASSLDLLVPFGAFWRSLHFYSSQVFFLFSVAHLVAIILAGSHRKMAAAQWLRLILSLVVILLLLFTGYILRSDSTGSSAGIIAENILLSIPVLGEWLNAVLFSIAGEGMKRIYPNHLIGLGLLWMFLAWNHIRRYQVSWRQHGGFTLAIILFSVFLDAPMEPERLGVFDIAGPWFFLGLQELLRHAQPFWAGIVFPASLVLALVLLNQGGGAARRAPHYILAWLVIYVGLTVVGLL